MTIHRYSDFGSGDDFGLYFKGTMVRLVPPANKGKPQWLNYNGLYPKGHNFGGDTPRDPGQTVSRQMFNKLYKIEVKYPVGLFNTKQSVILCERTGARYPYKGLSSSSSHGNYAVVHLEQVIREFVDLPQAMKDYLQLHRKLSFSVDLANTCFEDPKYFSLHEAVAQIRSRKFFARALSRDFALLPHYAHKDFLIMYRRLPVADLVSKSLKIKIHNQALRREVGEFFGAQGAQIV